MGTPLAETPDRTVSGGALPFTANDISNYLNVTKPHAACDYSCCLYLVNELEGRSAFSILSAAHVTLGAAGCSAGLSLSLVILVKMPDCLRTCVTTPGDFYKVT